MNIMLCHAGTLMLRNSEPGILNLKGTIDNDVKEVKTHLQLGLLEWHLFVPLLVGVLKSS